MDSYQAGLGAAAGGACVTLSLFSLSLPFRRRSDLASAASEGERDDSLEATDDDEEEEGTWVHGSDIRHIHRPTHTDTHRERERTMDGCVSDFVLVYILIV
jgi:hypothetical protein